MENKYFSRSFSISTLNSFCVLQITNVVNSMGAQIPGTRSPGQQLQVVTPNICGPSVWSLLHVTLLAAILYNCVLVFILQITSVNTTCKNAEAQEI
jgi:hypothetical protein